MPNLSVRNLGGTGIISDIRPSDLPPNVFSAGVNVRFENGTVSRGPIAREVFNLTAYDTTFIPGFLFAVPQPAGGPETLITVSTDYTKFYAESGSTFSNVTPSTIVSGSRDLPVTSSFLGGVTYVNHRSNVPFQFRPSDTKFNPLSNWDPTWRCQVLRAYKDMMVAFNVTKGSQAYPSMVKWSDYTQFGSPPPSWDATLTTNSAGENILNQMRGGIVDACALRDTMMIYGSDEVWAMNFVGGNYVFDFRKRFDDVGVIAANCIIEVDGQHYVFGRNDIIVHDGASKQSIVHGKDKDFIFGGIIRDLQYLCFVSHNPRLNEIHFCYPGNDRLAGFPNPTLGCNRAAVYNYRRDTWSFYDLPNVTSSCLGIVATGLTYDASDPTPYNKIGGTYQDGSSDSESHQLFTSLLDSSLGITANRIIGMDLMFSGRLSKPMVPELLKDAFLERIGVDLDESGAPMSSYKSLLKMYPALSAEGGDGSGITFQYGSCDVPGAYPTWGDLHPFNPNTNYQIDSRSAGRYLAHRLTVTGLTDFAYSGFDVNISVRGKR